MSYLKALVSDDGAVAKSALQRAQGLVSDLQTPDKSSTAGAAMWKLGNMMGVHAANSFVREVISKIDRATAMAFIREQLSNMDIASGLTVLTSAAYLWECYKNRRHRQHQQAEEDKARKKITKRNIKLIMLKQKLAVARYKNARVCRRMLRKSNALPQDDDIILQHAQQLEEILRATCALLPGNDLLHQQAPAFDESGEEEEQRTGEEDQPTILEEQPIIEEEQPMIEEELSTGEEEQSTGEEEPSSSESFASEALTDDGNGVNEVTTLNSTVPAALPEAYEEVTTD